MVNILGYCRTSDDSSTYYFKGKPSNVPILCFRIAETNIERTFGELRVYFDTRVWDVERDGIIYGDPVWLSDLHQLLAEKYRFCGGIIDRVRGAITYSEAGMQGDNYVSLDVNESFLAECDNFYLYLRGEDPSTSMFKLPELTAY